MDTSPQQASLQQTYSPAILVCRNLAWLFTDHSCRWNVWRAKRLAIPPQSVRGNRSPSPPRSPGRGSTVVRKVPGWPEAKKRET